MPFSQRVGRHLDRKLCQQCELKHELTRVQWLSFCCNIPKDMGSVRTARTGELCATLAKCTRIHKICIYPLHGHKQKSITRSLHLVLGRVLCLSRVGYF